MKKIAIIPLRKGSKGIKNKNKRKLLGRPLFQWVLGEAIFSELDEVYVFTDDDEIIKNIEEEYKWSPKVKIFKRSEESATDEASTEFGMLELATKINFEFDIYCLLQATSPLTTADDINGVIHKITIDENESALSVVSEKRFYWDTTGIPLNYNFLNRPRRQDFNGTMTENGAVYCIRKQKYVETKNRLGGKIGLYEMNEDTLYEIDEINDLVVVECLLEGRLKLMKKFPSKIKAVVFDVDGVLTDGKVANGNEGEIFKQFSVRDGMGFELLKENNIIPVILTSEKNTLIQGRFNKLKIEHFYCGIRDKYSFLTKTLNTIGLKRNEIAYVGDDINDLPNILSSGWSFCPIDAQKQIQHNSDFILQNKGGSHAVREAIEYCLKLNNKF